jgi:hypothetical protein
VPHEPQILHETAARPADWLPAGSAPFNRDLELAVIDRDGLHALVFPCRRILTGWIRSGTRQRIEVAPTHWREWNVDTALGRIETPVARN